MIDRSLNYGRHVLSDLLATLGKINNFSVLDIGAGKGDDLLICSKKMEGCSLYALEAYQPNVEILASLGVKTASVDLEMAEFPYSDSTFDLVIANQILEHCKEVFWIFHQVGRTLKVGGCFYIGVPNLASLHNRLLLLLGRQPTCIHTHGPHVRAFTKDGLLDFVDKCAPGLFSVEFFRGSNFYPFPPVIAKLLSKIFPNGSVSIFVVLRKNRDYESEFIKCTADLETNFWIG